MIIVARAQRCTRQCLRDYIFLPQLRFCLETERKFTDVGYDNIKKDCKIHIEVPKEWFANAIARFADGINPEFSSICGTG